MVHVVLYYYSKVVCMYCKLRKIRNENKLTTREMAEKLSISKPFYCQLENRSRRLSYDMAIKIAQVFKLKPDDIFFDDHIKCYK